MVVSLLYTIGLVQTRLDIKLKSCTAPQMHNFIPSKTIATRYKSTGNVLS